MFKTTKLAAGLLAACGGVLMSAGAYAQSQQLERVEITGSAIKRIDAETAVPVTILKLEDLKKEGITTVEQIVNRLTSSQSSLGTSQVVGAGTGGAAFADLRGIGANKTLVLLNGRRIANNALDSSAPDLNMIPFATLERVEVLRDGASSLYGTDAIGGVINFITKKAYQGITLTAGYDHPAEDGGKGSSFNIGGGYGDLDKDRFNVFGFVDYNRQDRITGTQRPFNTRIPAGISPTPFPANYFQAGDFGNPAAPDCTSAPNLISDGGTGCLITTASFVNYIPKTERWSGMLKGTLKITDNHTASLEYFKTRSEVESVIAPVPYGGLIQNRTRPDGTLNPFYPGNPGSSVPAPNIPLDPDFLDPDFNPAGALPGYVGVRFRNLAGGQRTDGSRNDQQRLVAALEGNIADWDYQAALSYNKNEYFQDLTGYSNGPVISAGVRDGVINPFGDQSPEGAALIASAALSGRLQNATGTVKGVDARASRELGNWLGAGSAALALGAEFRNEDFEQRGNAEFAEKVIASTGFDPATLNLGERDVYAVYAELNVPIMQGLDVTAAVRFDDYSDFGNTTNPKFSFRYQPVSTMLVRGSYSTGFRAPSLYEINAAQTYTNTSTVDDPVNCPGGVAIPGKPTATNCSAQFQALNGGNTNLKPEESTNWTLGIVFEPMPDVTLGADLWWLRVDQQIGSLSINTIFSDPTTFGQYILRNGSGNLSTDGTSCPGANCGYVDLRTQNLGDLKTNGIDFSASYRYRTDGFGSFNVGYLATWVMDYEYQNFADGPWNQNVGIYSGAGPIFRWQHNLSTTWTMGEFGAGLAVKTKTGYSDFDPANKVASYTTWDSYVSWMPLKELSVLFGIRNMFDRDPPFSNQDEVFQGGYDPRFSDPTGRTYYLRGSYSF